MSIAEKSLQLKKDFDDVYEAGKTKNDQDFWDKFQNKGVSKMNYQYAFAYSHYDDSNYNPKHPIMCTDSSTGGRYVFYQSLITDTKVPIYAPATTIQSMFYQSDIKTIRLLNVHETTVFETTFAGCSELVNIEMGGTIGKNFDIHWSTKLSKESIASIITSLSETKSEVTLTLPEQAVNNMTYPFTYKDVTYNSWDELIAPKSNWTISLA